MSDIIEPIIGGVIGIGLLNAVAGGKRKTTVTTKRKGKTTTRTTITRGEIFGDWY